MLINNINQNNNDGSYNADDYNSFKITKIYKNKPYLLELELKYAPDEYSKSSKVFYCLPQPDGTIKKSETINTDGVFTLKTDFDLRTEIPESVSLIIEDGEKVSRYNLYNINPMEQYRRFVFSTSYSSIYYNNEIELETTTISDIPGNGLSWFEGAAPEIVSAEFFIENNSSVIYNEKLIISKREKDSVYDDFCYVDLPEKVLTDIKSIKNFEIYVLLKDKNGVKYKCYPSCDLNIFAEYQFYNSRVELYFDVDGKEIKVDGYVE